MKSIFGPTFAAGVLASAGLTGCMTPRVGEQATSEQSAHRAAVAAVTAASDVPTLAVQGGELVAGGQADAQRRATEQQAGVVLRRSTRAWVGGATVRYAGEQLPSVFYEPLRLNFSDRPGLRTMAERLTGITGMPIRIKADAMADPGGAGVRVAAPAPTMLTSAVMLRETGIGAVPMEWSGTLADYLTHVTDLLGLSWEYRDGAVVLERFRTEYFELAAFDGEVSHGLTLSGSDSGSTSSASGGGGSSASNASSDVQEKGRSNTVESVIKAVKQIVKDVPGSEVIRSEGSGRLVVTTTREAMSKVRDFLRSEQEALLRQTQVQFDIYSVRSNDGDARGMNWDVVMQAMSRSFGMTSASPTQLVDSTAGSIGLTILDSSVVSSNTARRFGGSSAMVQLLNEYGHASTHRPVSLITLNRQWARKASLSNQAYVSETTPGVATTTGVGAPGLKTSTVTTGDRYVAMPVVLENGSVLLKFGIGLSNLVELANFSSGSGTTLQTVQIPETNAVIDQATIVLRPGQILAITGMSRLVASDKRRTLTEDSPVVFGGGRTFSREREDFIILVRPTLM